jgi:hypothetical protein
VVCLLLATGVATRAAATRAADDPITARAFEVRYRTLPDAADIVGSLLSPEGELTLKPKLGVLVVEDRQSVVERVESLLRSFDLPPRSVDVTLSLFLGTRRVDDATTRADTRRPVIDLPPLQFTKWTAYESLGSRSVQGLEGHEVVTLLSDNYQVAFVVEFVDERQHIVKFKNLTLQRISQTAEGVERVENLYSLAGVVDSGKQNIFGGAADPHAERALFLTVMARPR